MSKLPVAEKCKALCVGIKQSRIESSVLFHMSVVTSCIEYYNVGDDKMQHKEIKRQVMDYFATFKKASAPNYKQDKLDFLVEDFGFESAEDLAQRATFDSVSPGICMNVGCEYSTEVEPDQNKGHCELCNTQTVKSGLELFLELGG